MPPLFFIASLLLPACALAQTAAIHLAKEEQEQIGKRIFNNECAGKNSCLTSWNEGEAFPSLGIGHFIWYPAGASGPFRESFPELIRFMAAQGVEIPAWLSRAIKSGAPWASRELFLNAQDSRHMQQLRTLLSATGAIQTAFMIARLNRALPDMLAAVTVEAREHVRSRFEHVAAAPMGYYALIDYVNFKGEGTKISERYRGEGWGLLQVLQAMPAAGGDVLTEFSDAAGKVLGRRVANSPPERNEKRWLAGWNRRVETYLPKRN